MISTAVNVGMEDDVGLNGAISGLYTAAFSLGETCGASMGGRLNDKYGFQWTTTIFACVSFSMFFILMILLCCEISNLRPKSTKGEKMVKRPDIDTDETYLLKNVK